MNYKKQTDKKSPWFYSVLWLFFAYLFIQIFSYEAGNIKNIVVGGMYFIEFGVHEMSHLLVAFMPPIFVAAAGSIGEVSFTLLIVIAALKSKSYFAAIFGGLWMMLALSSVGRYMADARAQLLPLIGPGDQPIHDWNYVFGQLGWLQYDIIIGTFVRSVGITIGIAALGLGLWLIISMASSPKTVPVTLNK